jgi:hypothetical protein
MPLEDLVNSDIYCSGQFYGLDVNGDTVPIVVHAFNQEI